MAYIVLILFCGLSAGIVAKSVPEREFEETEHKAAAMKRAIELAASDAVQARATASARTPGGAEPEGVAR